MEEDKKKCFVIMPISDAEGYESGHFNRVYKHFIIPACEAAGFIPDRADDTSKANFIIVDILRKILDSDMVICDLSSRNPNVFYELGIRQAFNKKVVLICDDKTVKPFDTSGIRTLSYSASLRIDEVKKSVPELTKGITDTFGADAKEVNSLLQLLSIERPAILPEKITLSQDSSMILNAINDLGKRITKIKNSSEPSDSIKEGQCLTLPSGRVIVDGTTLYCHNQVLGEFIGKDEDSILIKRTVGDENQILKYKINDNFMEGLTMFAPDIPPF